MAKRQIFYSFHFKNDVMRVQQVRNIGALEDNKPVSHNEWETVKRNGDASIKRWIDDNMHYKSCVIVLVGEETANRPWVKYEIERAWNQGKGILGIYIHNLKCPNYGTSKKGNNPFEQFRLQNNALLSSIVDCYNPNPADAYGDIHRNLENWVNHAISKRR